MTTPDTIAEWIVFALALPWVVITPYFILAPVLPWVLELMGIRK